MQAIAFAPDGTLYGFNRDPTGEWFTISTTTGLPTSLGLLDFGPNGTIGTSDIRGVAWIPSPGAGALLLGVCAWRVARRRR